MELCSSGARAETSEQEYAPQAPWDAAAYIRLETPVYLTLVAMSVPLSFFTVCEHFLLFLDYCVGSGNFKLNFANQSNSQVTKYLVTSQVLFCTNTRVDTICSPFNYLALIDWCIPPLQRLEIPCLVSTRVLI
jgi:hypothetical protein